MVIHQFLWTSALQYFPGKWLVVSHSSHRKICYPNGRIALSRTARDRSQHRGECCLCSLLSTAVMPIGTDRRISGAVRFQ